MKTFDIHSIVSSPSLNTSRDGELFADRADVENLVATLVNGWWPDQSIELVILTDEQKEVVKDEVHPLVANASWGDYRIVVGDDTVIVDQVSLKAYIESHTSTKTKYFVNDGGRRIAALPLANIVRERKGMEPITSVPASVETYTDEVERAIANIAHNSSAGKRELGITCAILRLVCAMKRDKMLSMSAIADKLRLDKRRQRGVIQGLDYATELTLFVPQFADLPELFKAGVYRSPGSYLSPLVNGQTNRRAGKPTIKAGKTADDVETALRPADPNAPAKAKLMAKKDIEATSKDHPNQIVKDTAYAIVNDDRDSLAELAKYNRVVNAVVGLIDSDVPESTIMKALRGLIPTEAQVEETEVAVEGDND